MTSEPNRDQPFSSFPLPKQLADALEIMRYREPTPIQGKGIPVILEGKDLIGIAQTGTGKTAAFAIPMVKELFEDKEAQGLILVPTRELAMQIYEVIRQLTQNIKNLKAWVLVGGTSMFAQVKSLPRKPRLIIATPGRLMDHLDKRTFNLSAIKMVVLDEADRMLDIGFEPQIRRIFRHIPEQRQTLLFSATFPKQIERLTREYMKHPEKITIGKISQPAKEIEQSFIQTTVGQKNELLIQELNQRKGSVLVFVRTKHKVDRIAKLLVAENFEVDRIHGARTQGQRNRAISDFRNMKIRILVATDVASRGLDIPHIEHVINYDIPEVPEDYVHRIGRTARAGAKGESVSFLTPEDRSKWLHLSRHLHSMGVKTNMPVAKPASIMDKPVPSISSPKEPIIEYKKPKNYDRKRPFGGKGNSRSRFRKEHRSFDNSRPEARGPRKDFREGRSEPSSTNRNPRYGSMPNREGNSSKKFSSRPSRSFDNSRSEVRGPRKDFREGRSEQSSTNRNPRYGSMPNREGNSSKKFSSRPSRPFRNRDPRGPTSHRPR